MSIDILTNFSHTSVHVERTKKKRKEKIMAEIGGRKTTTSVNINPFSLKKL